MNFILWILSGIVTVFCILIMTVHHAECSSFWFAVILLNVIVVSVILWHFANILVSITSKTVLWVPFLYDSFFGCHYECHFLDFEWNSNSIYNFKNDSLSYWVFVIFVCCHSTVCHFGECHSVKFWWLSFLTVIFMTVILWMSIWLSFSGCHLMNVILMTVILLSVIHSSVSFSKCPPVSFYKV